MPFIPLILKTILWTLFSKLGKLLVKWIMKIITGPALEKILLLVLKKAAEKTDTKIDDEVVKALEQKVKPEQQEEKKDA